MPPRVPDGTRVYAVGDVHGRADLLREIYALSERDAAGVPGRKVLVHLGDYVDRGPESRTVLDILLGPAPAGFERVCLLGNHDLWMRHFLDDLAAGPGWLMNGGIATLESYGVPMPHAALAVTRLGEAQSRLRRALPDAHRTFLRELAPMHVEGDYAFVHAGVRPGLALARQEIDDLVWIRDEFLDSRVDHGKVVVHGHTISPAPTVRPNRIGIDTGAYASGRLTCLVLDGDSRRFLQT